MIKQWYNFRNSVLFNLFLPAFSYFYCLIEFAYRIALLIFYSPEKLKQIIVYSPCPWIFDPIMGFSYTKSDYYAFTITKGNGIYRSDKTKFYTDQYGNMSICKKRRVRSKILILGDSFTVGVGDAPNKVNWPDLMAGYSNFKDISILNYARDGVGILNMIDIAFHLCKINKYDQILFTPYIGDFLRPKIWRSFVRPVHNSILGRCFVGATNSTQELLKNKSDVAYVAKKKYKDLSDSQIKRIFQEAENIASEYFPRSNTGFNSNPLALYRIINRTCKKYLRIHNNNDSMNNQIPIKKYSMIPEFSEKCSFINSKAGKVAVILLPDFDSLNSAYNQKKQDNESISHELMKELTGLLSASHYILAERYNMRYGRPSKYFRTHVSDYHYSNLGLAWVAQEVAKIVNEK